MEKKKDIMANNVRKTAGHTNDIENHITLAHMTGLI